MSSCVTDSQLADLGLTVPSGRQQRPAPSEAPTIQILSSLNRIVSMRLLGADATRRAKPTDASVAHVYCWLGTTNPPDDVTQWSFRGSHSKVSQIDVAFSPDTPVNAQVWFTAQWLNRRQMPGPLAAAITTHIAGGVSGAGLSMKLAA